MKKFNLELAKAGHPLITRDGIKVEEISFLGNREVTLPIHCVIDDSTESYTAMGMYYSDDSESGHDLFIDDSVEWEKPLQEGDVIEVSGKGKNWHQRIFLYELKAGAILCVAHDNEKKYHSGETFSVYKWDSAEWRRTPKTPQIEISVKINGKESTLKDISKETLLKLREL